MLCRPSLKNTCHVALRLNRNAGMQANQQSGILVRLQVHSFQSHAQSTHVISHIDLLLSQGWVARPDPDMVWLRSPKGCDDPHRYGGTRMTSANGSPHACTRMADAKISEALMSEPEVMLQRFSCTAGVNIRRFPARPNMAVIALAI